MTERLVAGVERGTTGVAQSGMGRRAADTGVFASMIITDALIQMVGKIADENGKVDFITSSTCDGVDSE